MLTPEELAFVLRDCGAAVVHLAVTIVQWGRDGLIRKP
jgi:hypothetical protein